MTIGLVAAAAAGVLAACAAGVHAGWDALAGRPEFHLDLRTLSLDDCPEWVDCERMEEALRAELAPLPEDASIFRPGVAYAVRNELRGSPWLTDVREVRRMLPDRLAVRADFRVPAGIVLYGERHYLVDADGQWLPSDLFRPPVQWQSRRLPVIVDRLLRQPPSVGGRWDGPRFAVGAALTSFLLDGGLFDRLEVATMDVTGVGRRTTEPQILLTTTDGVTIKWGTSSAYAHVAGLTPPAPHIPDGDKLAKLLSKLADCPGLQGIQYVDLRFDAVYVSGGEPGPAIL